MPKARFRFSFSDQLLVGSMPVWRDAIYVAELFVGFYLVYIRTSYWVEFLASVTQHRSIGSCDFHSSVWHMFYFQCILTVQPVKTLATKPVLLCSTLLTSCRAAMNSNGGNKVAVRITFLTLYKVCFNLIETQNRSVLCKVRCGVYDQWRNRLLLHQIPVLPLTCSGVLGLACVSV